jgi:arsenate reductase
MLNRKPKVLFLSTGDATRSKIAGAFLRRFAGESFDVKSAAVNSNASHPLTNDVMQEVGVDMSGAVSESVAESLKDRFNYVITICDAVRERHPIFPFTPRLLHWSVADPADAEGSPGQSPELLRRVRDQIQDQVSGFLAGLAQAEADSAEGREGLARAASVNGAIQEQER